jgi:Ras homolog enriched in brain
VQFVENHFVESYYPTIENTFSKTIKFKGQEFTTEIIDTAGQVWRTNRACPNFRMNIVF